ncbi:MAG: Single-stranded DNA-binding protein ssb [Firmicutes bacterium ADurb.Bin193]|nr:MAG: Single-stranded DNA-binding protein ssb [Firmicutes bacterium ADurb.Bin193]
MQNLQTNNSVVLVGKICTEFVFSHEVYYEKFYNFSLDIARLSGVSDIIIITASEQLTYGKNFKPGDNVYIIGQFRSYNNYTDVGNKLKLTVFAKEILPAEQCERLCDIETEDEAKRCINEINLIGFICKQPVYRTTPFGREITDLLVAVNRTYNKSDYIPCIAWGRNSKFAGSLQVGDKVAIKGRIQSREYQKKICEDETVTKTAYEVSISKISLESDPEPAECI